VNKGRINAFLDRVMPLVDLMDLIRDVKACDATLADCMLQLIWAHHKIIHMKVQNGED